jgi:hypothetical protein
MDSPIFLCDTENVILKKGQSVAERITPYDRRILSMKRIVSGLPTWKRLAMGLLSGISALAFSGAIATKVAKADGECADVIVYADDDPCTQESCDLAYDGGWYCVYECTYEYICCW